MLLSQSNLCIPVDKHCDSKYRQMKEVESEWRMKRWVSIQGARTERPVSWTQKNNSTCPLQELMNVPPELLGFLVNTKSHLLMEGLSKSAVAET